jgi:hypothetical protein
MEQFQKILGNEKVVFFGCDRQNESDQLELGIGMNFISYQLLYVAFTMSYILFGIATTDAQTATTPYLSPEDGGPRNWTGGGAISELLNLHQEPKQCRFCKYPTA